MITSLHNPRVKAAVRLRDRRGRDDQGRMIIDGLREISRALAGGVPLVEVFHLSASGLDEPPRRLLQAAEAAGAELIEVSAQVMEKLAYGHRLQPVIAVAVPPKRSLSDLCLPSKAVVAVIEGVEKPGNLGAVLRTADAAGVAALIVADGETDLYNPNAIRASLGAIFTVPVCAATSEESLAWLRARQFRIFAARVDAQRDYTAADFCGNVAVALGSEARGLSAAWHAQDITPIRIPLLGQVDSLNLSAAAAVLFYEALRQRRRPVG